MGLCDALRRMLYAVFMISGRWRRRTNMRNRFCIGQAAGPLTSNQETDEMKSTSHLAPGLETGFKTATKHYQR